MKLAGVTFHNRQSILGSVYKRPGHISVIQMKETTFNGQRAVECVDVRTGTTLGWVPKTELASHPSFPDKMHVRVDIYKDIYYGVIENTQPPTHNVYYAVKSICRQDGIMLPDYDSEAFLSVLIERRRKTRCA